jgi:hypothetical protein
MMSTFDLTLLGSLVSAGGLAFLSQGQWPSLSVDSLGIGKRPSGLTAEHREHHARAAALAGARWLTVGALTLFMAYVQGADEGYLFGPWTDILFHLVFVSTGWVATAYRMNQAVEKAITATLTTIAPTSVGS